MAQVSLGSLDAQCHYCQLQLHHCVWATPARSAGFVRVSPHRPHGSAARGRDGLRTGVGVWHFKSRCRRPLALYLTFVCCGRGITSSLEYKRRRKEKGKEWESEGEMLRAEEKPLKWDLKWKHISKQQETSLIHFFFIPELWWGKDLLFRINL